MTLWSAPSYPFGNSTEEGLKVLGRCGVGVSEHEVFLLLWGGRGCIAWA